MNSPQSGSEKITDTRVIAGIFREALFHQSHVFFHKNLEIDRKEFAYISHVSDASIREENSKRTFTLTFTHLQDVKRANNPKFTFFIGSKGFTFELSANIVNQLTSVDQVLPLPEILEVFSRRKAEDIRVKLPTNITSNALIVSGSDIISAQIEITDISAVDFGGFITVSNLVNVKVGSQITCKVRNENGEKEFEGQIVRLDLIDTNGIESNISFGAKSHSLAFPLSHSESSADLPFSLADRRSDIRTASKDDLKLHSPLLPPAYALTGAVRDISASGFSWIPSDPFSVNYLPLGALCKVADQDIFANLKAISNEALHFEILSGGLDGRVWWGKFISEQFKTTRDANVGIGDRLVELFCNSGALNPLMIKYNREKLERVQAISTNTTDNESVLRWIELGDESGYVRGQITAIRYSDNLWYISDLAGQIEKEKKLSREFGYRFYKFVGKLFRSLVPKQYFFYFWNKGHPVWEASVEPTRKMCDAESNAFLELEFFRVLPIAKATTSVNISKISGSDSEKITKLRKQCPDNLKPVLDHLDFNSQNFSSPILRSSFARQKVRYEKIFLEYQTESFSGIVCFTEYPSNVSVNQATQIGFILPMNSEISDASHLGLVADAVTEYLLKTGLKPIGFLIPNSTGKLIRPDNKSMYGVFISANDHSKIWGDLPK